MEHMEGDIPYPYLPPPTPTLPTHTHPYPLPTPTHPYPYPPLPYLPPTYPTLPTCTPTYPYPPLPLPTPTHPYPPPTPTYPLPTLQPYTYSKTQHFPSYLIDINSNFFQTFITGFHFMRIKIRGNNPILAPKSNVFLHISSTSSLTSFKPSEQGFIS